MAEHNKVKTMIIGAGPAGMAAAMELHHVGEEFVVIEKKDRVGGLATTYIIREGDLEFRTDNGPHRFFSKNKYLYDFIENLLDEKWIVVKRQTRQYIDGKFYDYPINAVQAMKNVGPLLVVRMMIDYLLSVIQYKILRWPIRNFYDYAIANFGKTLAYFNIINYTEKIWGISTKEMDAEWAKQRIKGLSVRSLLASMIKKAIKGSDDSVKTLVDEFYYPEYGTSLIYETIQKKIEAGGKRVELQSQPTKILHDNTKITQVVISHAGQEMTYDIENLIESIHIDDFIALLDPVVPGEVLAAAERLKFRTQVYLFITLDKEKLTDDQWLYFPDDKVPFARWSEMKNFSDKMAPTGKTSLFLEYFCDADDPIYSMTAEQLLEISLPHFERFGFFTKADIRHIYKYSGGKDYPIYDIDYQKNLRVVKDYLRRFPNLYFIGRPGRFQYTNQDHSLEMGIAAAKSIINKKPIDLDAIGMEHEYFEAGAVRQQEPTVPTNG